MILRPVAEIRDPVHGYVRITEVERDIIDSPFLQRLRRVHQLAGSYLVYPGAVHTRFEHVLGAMHVAGRIGEALREESTIPVDTVEELRLAALLHDVGHGPFSHMYEEVLAGKEEVSHEDISRRIILETSVRDILGAHGYSAKRISSLSVGRLKGGPPFLNEVIAGGLSSDIMDYLLRDSYFTGVEYGKVDVWRVIDSLREANGQLVLLEAALPAFEAMLLARYEMFKAVYFHKTVRAAELMLVQSMQLADETLGLTDLSDLERYLELTDEIVLHRLANLDNSTPELRQARRLAVDFRNRRLVKCVFERVYQRKGKALGGVFADPVVRARTAKGLSERSGVPQVNIFIDVPTTPSVPYTSSKDALTEVRLMRSTGHRKTTRTIPIGRLPLVGSIAGFMDVLRVYTTAEHRGALGKAAREVLKKGNRV